MSWQTKEDVLEDLSEVMGNEIKELDEQCILIGEQPPTLPCTSNETDHDELYLRLNEALEDKIINEDSSGPDLSGITEMLRMVDHYHCSNNLENETNWLQNYDSNGISIIKLNIDVPEIIPKNDKCIISGIENRHKEYNIAQIVDNKTQTRMNVDDPEFMPKNDKCSKSGIENRNKENNEAKIIDNKTQTRMNVDVPEFIPKNDKCSKSGIENRNKENNEAKIIDNKTQTRMNVDVPEFIPKNDKCDKSVIENRNEESNNANINNNSNITQARMNITEETIDSAQVKEISEKLKAKITSPSETTCLKKKSERNLAIASLLKLYSNATPVPDEKAPKLITPEYFQQTDSKLFSENYSQKKIISPGPSYQAIKVEDAVEITKKVNSTDLVMEESVAKVNSWLNKEITKNQSVTKESALYLGPITFKKKDVKKPKTSNSNTSEKSQNRIGEKSFVPSEYASTLTQSYMDRVKAIEDKTIDIWGKLERDLKVKDKEITAKRQQQPSAKVP